MYMYSENNSKDGGRIIINNKEKREKEGKGRARDSVETSSRFGVCECFVLSYPSMAHIYMYIQSLW